MGLIVSPQGPSRTVFAQGEGGAEPGSEGVGVVLAGVVDVLPASGAGEDEGAATVGRPLCTFSGCLTCGLALVT